MSAKTTNTNAIYICKCGKIHMYDSELVTPEKSLTVSCSCGRSVNFWLEDGIDGYYYVTNTTPSTEDIANSTVITSDGYAVPMTSGKNATAFYSMADCFEDENGCNTVDMEKLCETLPENVLDTLSNYAFSMFDWSGTSYNKW